MKKQQYTILKRPNFRQKITATIIHVQNGVKPKMYMNIKIYVLLVEKCVYTHRDAHESKTTEKRTKREKNISLLLLFFFFYFISSIKIK